MDRARRDLDCVARLEGLGGLAVDQQLAAARGEDRRLDSGMGVAGDDGAGIDLELDGDGDVARRRAIDLREHLALHAGGGGGRRLRHAGGAGGDQGGQRAQRATEDHATIEIHLLPPCGSAGRWWKLSDVAGSHHKKRREMLMKVTDVTCHILQCKVDKPFVSARGWVYGTRSTCLVEISTDEGITGWGECYGPAAVAKTFVETQYKARVIGRDPFDVEAIWEDLYNRIKDYGTTGMAISAISGIDIALWDIMGRAVGKPVHKLIGGAYRSEVIAYATGLYFIDMERLVEEAVEEALAFKNDGFRAIKMKIGLGDLKLDARRVGAVRKTIGPDVKLAVDANHCFSVPPPSSSV